VRIPASLEERINHRDTEENAKRLLRKSRFNGFMHRNRVTGILPVWHCFGVLSEAVLIVI